MCVYAYDMSTLTECCVERERELCTRAGCSECLCVCLCNLWLASHLQPWLHACAVHVCRAGPNALSIFSVCVVIRLSAGGVPQKRQPEHSSLSV
jgi:hypothetical protein